MGFSSWWEEPKEQESKVLTGHPALGNTRPLPSAQPGVAPEAGEEVEGASTQEGEELLAPLLRPRPRAGKEPRVE